MHLRSHFRSALAALLLAITCALANQADALPTYLETAKTTYNFKPGGTIAVKRCNLCHAGATNANSLNFFGKDLKSALKSSGGNQVTPALLHSLDAVDSDGDGFPNGAEFKADTLPGDPSSKPVGPPPGSLKPTAAGKSAEEFNPFSLKSLFFPSSAQHPVVVHFPIALFVFSLFLDMFGVLRRNPAFNAAAYYNLLAAAVTGVVSVITGLLAWRIGIAEYGGISLNENRWLLFHLVLAVTTTVLICLLCIVRTRHPKNADRPLSNLYVILAVLTFMTITLTGHLGGIVSGVVK